MPLRDALLPEFDHEKPHEKSGTMGWLAGHIANIPGWAVAGIKQDSIDLAPGGVHVPSPAPPENRDALLRTFDENVATARAAISGAEDAHLAEKWSLLMNGKPVFTMPRSGVLRSFVMNHLIHHRAQLGVYLRLNEIPVPASYGPSADESAM
jgi:uncharacterized damage-inducible protein DinB